eukprot:CAMPEP_0177625406 /NCGR_PEP_ID=MMETSP0419_2-20121207/30080_1 /TAXON_ID=582737 /ORGANISM="Tetraselmis sp., Strain GSL018" /LENGTH=1497 /DNA_ID=CAMNT_0019126345 /DNA_START=66 /DNA_END=4559 /DNA_ORIENTATION=-
MAKVPDTLQRVSFHKKGGPGILVHCVFVLLYGIALQQCYNTIGEPYRLAEAEQRRLHDERASRRVQALFGSHSNETNATFEVHPTVVQGSCVGEEEGACSISSSDAPEVVPQGAAVAEGAPRQESEPGEHQDAAGEEDASAGLSLSALAEDADLPPGVEDVEDDDDSAPLPSKLLPGFWPSFSLAAIVAFHVLFMFMSHWFVGWKVFMEFRPTRDPAPGTFAFVTPAKHQGKEDIVPVFAFVTPAKHQGKEDIVPVTRSSISGLLSFDFQHHKYVCKPPGEDGNDGKDSVVEHLDCPDNLPLRVYLEESSGLSSSEAEVARDKFGANSFEIPCPTFAELYKKQLMSPVAVFQIFCMLLWMLDQYWKYTAFTLVCILMFEGSTAFSRLRNLKVIRGMGNQPSKVRVLRGGKWIEATSDQLLPGDLVSLQHEQGQSNVVPCDALILSGTAVVNESTLTGESIPQMKGALRDNEDRCLDIDNRDKIHTLFSGTTLMQHTPGEGRVQTPDGGLLCFVLRTGFRSSQGTLMRMVEFSTEKVASDKKETAMLLGLLFCFACASSGYVLYEGLKDESRSRYQLLLRCVLILTSVVPPDLPMQMALAVQTALMSLHKANIFCTEPFRIPYAGRVTHCLFDKTGTLTTDQLVAVGVVDKGAAGTAGDAPRPLVGMEDASDALCCVIGGCHSLIEVQSQLMGDPIELAALGAIKWLYKPTTKQAFPRPASADPEGRPSRAGQHGRPVVEIVERHHFSSALQRMSTIALVTPRSGGSAEVWSLVKGSPEAIAGLLAPEAKPEWYDRTYRALAERGMRVLATAYRRIPPEEAANAKEAAAKPREWAESRLEFSGFVAFSCLSRKDTSAVIAALSVDAGQYTAMITGDAPLTALQVANEVCITSGAKEKALLLRHDRETGAFEWEGAYSGFSRREPFSAAGLPALGRGNDLMVTGDTLAAAAAAHPEIWRHMDSIRVFARMSPDGKADVIKALKECGHGTLMCGDGGNDVGALKQADVGLALLSGFGNMNAEASSELRQERDQKPKDAMAPLEKLKATQKELADRAATHRKYVTEEMAKKKREIMSQQQARVEAEMERRRQEGQTGVMANFGALRKVVTDMQKEMREYQAQLMKNAPKQEGKSSPLDGLAALEDSADMMPIVKLGDASIAAPFTSKMPSVSSVIDIIRQGRCTLVNTVQQQQILMLNCMISAFCLAVMHMEGSRSSEEQLISTGLLLTVASFAFSFAKPVEKMSPVRPPKTVFHPALFISVLGQLAIHVGCIIWVVVQAKAIMGEEELKKAIHISKLIEKAEMSGNYPEELTISDGVYKKHHPNLLNTCVFLVETSQQVAVMAVNYKGRPWMLGATENTGLLWSLALCAIGLMVAVNEVIPELNKYLGFVTFPNDSIKRGVVICVVISMFGSFLWDRLCLFLFARPIFMASIQEVLDSKLSDFKPQLRNLGIAAAVAAWLFLMQGNLLVPVGAWYLWKQRQRQNAAQAQAPTPANPQASR